MPKYDKWKSVGYCGEEQQGMQQEVGSVKDNSREHDHVTVLMV